MSQQTLQQELIELVFSPEGLLSCFLPAFEERKEQRAMALQIFDAYLHDQIALIEAGTGTGKSLAYLVPALYWALKHHEKTIISTHTIALQEQLVNKDIPFLLKAMSLDLKVVLVKGMNNYLCLKKFEEHKTDLKLFFDQDDQEMQSLEAWAQKTQDGSRSQIPFSLSSSTWEKVGAENDACAHRHCPHFKKCFFFKARNEAAEAQILVVNHHLLLADIASRRRKDYKEEKAILPHYQRLVLDEAHHLEEIALETFSKRIDKLGLFRLLAKIFSEQNPEISLLGAIKNLLTSSFAIADSGLIQRLEIDLPAQKREIVTYVNESFFQLEKLCDKYSKKPSGLGPDQKWLFGSEYMPAEGDIEECEKHFLEMNTSLKRLLVSLSLLAEDLEEKKKEPIKDKLQILLVELLNLISRLEESSDNIDHFFSTNTNVDRVRYIEKALFSMRSSLTMVDADLDVSTILQEGLFQPTSTVALCSATLTAKREFSFFKQKLGLIQEELNRPITENIYDSPFNFQERSLLLVPTDLPNVSEFSFNEKASETILEALEASQGNAFVLFTSYDMLKSCYERLASNLSARNFFCLKQGDASRQLLIEQFKSKPRSVLFATDSFWEGVDVAGEALRCVIIAKLPFKVPSDPLVQARNAALIRLGKDPFLEDSLPQAALKFKQGFGRLLRKKNDRGCVVCLDKRLVTKGYGKVILETLPPCRTLFSTSKNVIAEMHKFYREVR